MSNMRSSATTALRKQGLDAVLQEILYPKAFSVRQHSCVWRYREAGNGPSVKRVVSLQSCHESLHAYSNRTFVNHRVLSQAAIYTCFCVRILVVRVSIHYEKWRALSLNSVAKNMMQRSWSWMTRCTQENLYSNHMTEIYFRETWVTGKWRV